ncbi:MULTISPECIES: hypothetical protein [Lysinibacillus]|uniref:hypothetical protein n=1 Tax=Lysinibacillus TaxID=400634 RepID=UPI00257C1769|nr:MULTISPECIES: hypothetical protein [Lysinibacillus]
MSFKNEYTLNVDIKRRMTSVVPTFKQGDSATLKFKLFDDGKKFDLAAFTRAEITFKLPSGQTIVGEPYIDVNTQMIVYNFVGVEMNEAGKLTTILSIYSGTSMVSIQPFSIFIFDHLKDKDLSYIGILQDLIAEVQLLNEEVKSTLSEANNLKDKLNNVLIEANNAEQIRNTNEQNRITSENTRNSNESARQQNELDRKNAESIRESNEAIRIKNEQNRQKEFDNKINEAEEAITDTKKATNEANQAAESIKGWGQATVWNSTTTYSKNNVVTYNGSTWQSKGDNNLNSIPSETNANWILLALRGVDGTGAVSTVNGKSPDGAGNVELTVDEIGTYTQQQIDDKDTAIKEYFTDKGIGDKVIVISEQDYIDADYNGMFWVKNDALDFLPTEADHAATLLVYENPDNENVVKIFNVINPTTAISYMRTYTYDHTSSLIHDSGWIEGGGGSGTGGGGNVSVNSYPLVTDSVSQTIWELPIGIYNQVTDSVMVFHNTVFLEQVSYTLTNNRLSIPDNPHTEIEENNVVLVVFRNMPNMKVEFDGNNIIDGSIPLSKLGQDVQDAINNAGGKIELVDNLTTDDATKALAASQGVVIKKELDKKWQKGVYNDTDITNLGSKRATRTFTINQSDWKNTGNVELLDIIIPFRGAFSGVIKATYSVMWGMSGSWGSTEVVYNIGSFIPETKLNDFTIVTASSAMMRDFKVGKPYIDNTTGDIAIQLYRAPDANNPLEITLTVDGTYSSSTYNSNLFNALKDSFTSTSDTGSPTGLGYPWTPQASQIPTYDAIYRWDRKSDSIAFDKSNGTTYPDPNTFLDTTFITNHANAQNAGENSFWYIEQVFYGGNSATNARSQFARSYLGNADMKVRHYHPDTGWSAWSPSIQQLFTSVSDGKTKVASAISDKGVYTSPVETFDNMANNIRAIPTGGKKATISISYNDIPPNQTTTVTSQPVNFLPLNTTTDMLGSVIFNGQVRNVGDNAQYISVPYISEITVNGIGNGQFTLSFKIKNPMIIVGYRNTFQVVLHEQ